MAQEPLIGEFAHAVVPSGRSGPHRLTLVSKSAYTGPMNAHVFLKVADENGDSDPIALDAMSIEEPARG